MLLYFLIPGMLIGLIAVAVPPLIHLLNRRRHDVVDWGAMQFLKVSETTRRRMRLEEMLLLLMRMLMIGVLVCALAAPFVESQVLGKLGGRPNRDVVVLIDGSASMSDVSGGKSTHDSAREWVDAFLADLSPGDAVAVLQAKEQVVPVQGHLTGDLAAARQALASLPPPRGGADWREAFAAAFDLLKDSGRPEREVIVVSDNQRLGWADETSLLKWELFAGKLRQTGVAPPRIWAVNLGTKRTGEPANWSLTPLKPSRAVCSVGQEVRFRTSFELHGQTEYKPPHKLRLEVDGKFVRDLTPPAGGKLDKGQVPFSFGHRFAEPGPHLVTLIVEPDMPGSTTKDVIPADNRQDFAVEVLPALPVLLVDGDTRPNPKYRGTDFLRDALSPARDPNPSVLVRVVPVQDFTAQTLTENVGKKPGTVPRVLVLSDVAVLTSPQLEAVEQFLANGGGVLVTLGERAEAAAYNDQLYRNGDGWLPAHLDDLAGDETSTSRAASPLASSFFHPALELFRDVPAGGLADAKFPRWWKVRTVGKNSPGVPVALLSSNDPFLVERQYRRGRVMLCSVPLDNSWKTNLPDLPAFAPLAHELVYYLAGTRGNERNLQPGQPLRIDLPGAWDALAPRLTPPDRPTRPLVPDAGDPDAYAARLERGASGDSLVYEATREPGVYRIDVTGKPPTYFVVQPDARESDLTPCSPKERDKVAEFVPLSYVDDRDALTVGLILENVRHEMWWVGFVVVVGFLCGELWLTRRIVRGR